MSPEAGSYPVEGTLIYAEADTVRLYVTQQRSVISVPVVSITRLEVFRGRMGSVGAAVKGAGIGTVAGAAMGVVIGATAEAVFGEMFGGKPDCSETIGQSAVCVKSCASASRILCATAAQIDR